MDIPEEDDVSWIFLFFLFIPQILLAEEWLETIEVGASKELSDFHLGSSEVYDLERSPTLLTDELRSSTGITASQNGGPGGRASFFVRGTEARHLAFTIDQLKINDPSNTDRQYDAAFLSTPFLKNVTLYKGPQAVLFGSDAMGGLVDMRTRKGESPGETRFAFNAGSFGSVDSSLSHDWGNTHHQGTFTTSSMRTDGISRLNKKRFAATERDGADLTQITSSSQHKPAPKWQTDLLFSYLRGHNELDGATDDNSFDEGRSDQLLLQQKTNFEVAGKKDISLRTGLSRHQREVKTLRGGEESYEGDLNQNELLYRQEAGNLKFLTGLSQENENYEDKTLEKRATLSSAFMQTSWDWQSTTMQAGVRSEEHSQFGFFPTGAVGISQKCRSHLFSTQYSQGFKAPSLYQLYGPPIFGSPVGNKNLLPERNHAWEARWVHEKDIVKTELSLFQNRLSNLITYTNQGYVNQGKFISEGLELSLDLTLGHFRIRPTYLQQNFRKEATTVLRRPREQESLKLSYFPRETLELSVNYRHSGPRKDFNETGNVTKLNEFEVYDLGAKLELGRKTFGVHVVNVLNREYEELYGYSVMPRSAFAHFGYKF